MHLSLFRNNLFADTIFFFTFVFLCHQMMLFGRDISPELENILEFMDWVFLVIFTAEMVLKLLGFGVTL